MASINCKMMRKRLESIIKLKNASSPDMIASLLFQASLIQICTSDYLFPVNCVNWREATVRPFVSLSEELLRSVILNSTKEKTTLHTNTRYNSTMIILLRFCFTPLFGRRKNSSVNYFKSVTITISWISISRLDCNWLFCMLDFQVPCGAYIHSCNETKGTCSEFIPFSSRSPVEVVSCKALFLQHLIQTYSLFQVCFILSVASFIYYLPISVQFHIHTSPI